MSTPKPQPSRIKSPRVPGPYPPEAYEFVQDGLTFTANTIHGVPGAEQPEERTAAELPGESSRHVSGQQLCLGLRDFAIDRYGFLAPAVLEHWHIRRTDDFGRIVFNLIEAGCMSKTAEDSLEDFRCVFDFGEAFSRGEIYARLGSLARN